MASLEAQGHPGMRKLDTSEPRDKIGMHRLGLVPHLPDIYVSFFITSIPRTMTVFRIPTLIAIIHHFHFPARREGFRDDFRGPFQVQSLQVPNSEERAGPDAADGKTCTARTELPLQYEVRDGGG